MKWFSVFFLKGRIENVVYVCLMYVKKGTTMDIQTLSTVCLIHAAINMTLGIQTIDIERKMSLHAQLP